MTTQMRGLVTVPEDYRLYKDVPAQETIDCADVEEFFEAIRRDSPNWHVGSLQPWVFRGVSDSTCALLPRSWRSDVGETHPGWHAAQEQARIAAAVHKHDSERDYVASLQYLAECAMVARFQRLCNDRGLRAGSSFIDEPLHRQMQYRLSPPNSRLHELAFAQHYGVPTTLLDWTKDPLVAAFFAAHSESHADRIAVWALREGVCLDPEGPFGTNFHHGPSDWSLSLVRPPRHDNDFLHHQEGVLTQIRQSHTYYEEYGSWPSVDAVVTNDWEFRRQRKGDALWHGFAPLTKITLGREHTPTLLAKLKAWRVWLGAVKPTFENIALWVCEQGIGGLYE